MKKAEAVTSREPGGNQCLESIQHPQSTVLEGHRDADLRAQQRSVPLPLQRETRSRNGVGGQNTVCKWKASSCSLQSLSEIQTLPPADVRPHHSEAFAA